MGNLLNYWPLSDTNWVSGFGDAPLGFTNLNSVPSWEGAALSVDTNVPAFLNVSATGNISFTNGAVSMWFAPDWTDSADGGSGPQSWSSLFQLGRWSSNNLYGCWSLAISPDGNTLAFVTQTNGAGEVPLSASVAFNAGEWNYIVLTYDSTVSSNCSIYLNGAWLADGTAIQYRPSDAECVADGLCIGSELTGVFQARGQLDDFRTYDYVLSPEDIANVYNTFGSIIAMEGYTVASPLAGFHPNDIPSLPGGGTNGGAPVITYQPLDLDGGYVSCGDYTNYLIGISNGSSTVTLSLTGTVSGVSYVLLEKTNLNQSNWAALQTVTATNNGLTFSSVSKGTNYELFFESELSVTSTPPVLTQPLTNQVVWLGSNAIFTVSAFGATPLSYWWQFDGTNLSDGGSIAGSSTSNLTISAVATNNAGSYTIFVSNSLCVATSTATLNIVGTLKWRTYLGGSNDELVLGGMDASPALSLDGSTIYIVTTSNFLYALSTVNGQKKWTNNVLTNDAAYWQATELTSSPAVGMEGTNETIYVGSNDGHLYAVNTNGDTRWALDLSVPIYATPAIGPDGTVYVGTDDPANPSTTHARFFAVTNGAIKWSFTPQDPSPQGIGNNGGDVESSAAIGYDGTLYFIGEGSRFHAVSTNGNLLWFSPLPGHSEPDGSPAIGADGTLYIGGGAYPSSDFYAFNPDGSLKWAFDVSVASYYGYGVQTPPAIGPDNTIYFATWQELSDGTLFALNPDGSYKWSVSILSDGVETTNLSTPAVAADGTVYVGSADGNLYAVTNAGASAGVSWSYQTGGEIYSSPVIGSDGTIYVGSADGYLYAFYGTAPLATNAPWPMFHQNAQHTGLQNQPTVPPPDDCGAPFVYDGILTTDSSNNPTSFTFTIFATNTSSWYVFASSNLTSWAEAGNVTLTNGIGDGNGTNIFTTNFTGIVSNQYFILSSGTCLSNSCRSRIIGFANMVVPPGTNFIANQFCEVNQNIPGLSIDTPMNTLDGLFTWWFPSSYDGVQILKWNGEGLITFTFNGDFRSEWTTASGANGSATVSPGEGVLFNNATGSSIKLPFVGILREQQTFAVSAGTNTNYFSATFPMAGAVTNVTSYVPRNGDKIQLWNYSNQVFSNYTFVANSWLPTNPTVKVGEGFVLITTNAINWTNTWQQNFPCP